MIIIRVSFATDIYYLNHISFKRLKANGTRIALDIKQLLGAILRLLYYKFCNLKIMIFELIVSIRGSLNLIKNGNEEISIVAITVSTGYDDLLEYLLPQNLPLFDKWIIVTDKKDLTTQNLVNLYPEVKLILVNFKSWWRVFNKGKGIRKAQLWAYKNFPSSWYLLLDSDILISTDFSRTVRMETELKNKNLYGSFNRLDFKKMSDLKSGVNFLPYEHNGDVHGYFQLYKMKRLYRNSRDASWCDLQFSNRFREKILLHGFTCDHLGVKGNWKGRTTKDFVFDLL